MEDDLGSKSEEGDEEWESPAKTGVGHKASEVGVEDARLHPPEHPQQVEAHHRHPAEHGKVGKETKVSDNRTSAC